jgi:chemotaxis protein histidine kinase CheA
MPQDDVALLTQGEDGTVVRSNGKITPIADAPLSQDIAQEIENVNREVRETSGVSNYERGGSEKAVYSAAAAKIIDAASSIRVEERRDEVAKAIGTGARVLYNILRSTVKRDWPEMRFLFNVDITTMQRPDDEGKRAQLIQLEQIAQPFPNFNANNWLQDISLAFLKPPQRYINPPQPPQPSPEAQKAQVEIQVMQAKAQTDMQSAQMDLNIKQQLAQLQIQQQQMKLQFEVVEAQLRMQEQKQKLVAGAQKTQNDVAEAVLDAAQSQQDLRHKEVAHRQETIHAAVSHKQKMAQAKATQSQQAAQAAAKKKSMSQPPAAPRALKPPPEG